MPKMQETVDAIEAMRSPRRLLVLTERIKSRLKEIFVITSSTDPVGHYAEWLAQKVFGGELADSASQSGYDLTDRNGRKIQVKGRVLREWQHRRGARIHENNLTKFDYLVLVVFDNQSYRVLRALGMTSAVFYEVSRTSGDFSRWSINSDDSFLNAPDVDDLTNKFRDKQ